MADIRHSAVSTEHLIIIATIVGISSLVGYFLFCGSDRRLPPLINESILETIQIFMRGKDVPVFILTKMREYGQIFRLSIPERGHWITICDPAFARQILLEEEEKPVILKRLNGFTNGVESLITRDTNTGHWHAARKGVASSFSTINICVSLPKFYDKINDLKRILNQHVKDGTHLQVAEIMTNLTMDLISTAMFGVDYRTMESSESEGRQLMHEIELGLKEYVLKQLYNPIRFLMFWDTDLKRAQQAVLAVAAAQKKVLDNYRATKTTSEIAEDCSILGHLVRSPYPSDIERCADMSVFMVGGHETAAHTLAWIIIEMARNPAMRMKLKAEIDATAPDTDNITQKQLNEMTYLDYVIKEGMRLWPVAAMGSYRIASKDIPYKSFIIPKGSILNVPFFAIFRSDGITDPDNFIPERWAPDNPEAEKLKELYFPFSLGKRNCVGQNLASLQTKLVLASVFQSFQFELLSPVESDYFLTLKAIATIKVLKAN